MRRKYYPQIVIFAICFLLFISCHEPTPLGSEIIPPEDYQNVIFTDTLSLEAFTELDDSVSSSALDVNPLGSMADPVFGNSFTAIATQLRVPRNNINLDPLGLGITLDSVVLALTYGGDSYGDKNAAHNIIVYQLSEELNVNTEYNSSSSFTYDPVEIGRKTNFIANTTDSVIVVKDTLEPHLRIRLNQSFGDMLVNQSGTENFKSNTTFQNFIKGLYITPDTLSGFGKSVMFLNMNTDVSGLELHYRVGNDTLLLIFPIDNNIAKFNISSHNYNNTIIQDHLDSLNTEDTSQYLQGMGGVRVRVKIPDLQEAFGNISINKAELVLTAIEESTSETFPVSEFVAPFTLQDPEVGPVPVSDAALSLILPVYQLGGFAGQETENGKEWTRYKIQLAKHLYLAYYDFIENSDVLIRSFPSAEDPSRIIFGGAKHPNENLRLKLRLYYTKLQ